MRPFVLFFPHVGHNARATLYLKYKTNRQKKKKYNYPKQNKCCFHPVVVFNLISFCTKENKKCSTRKVNLIENVLLESLWQYWFFHKPPINRLSVCCAEEHESPRLPRTLCAAEWRNRASVSGHRTLKLQATRDVTLVTTSNCNGWNIVVYRRKKKNDRKTIRMLKEEKLHVFHL